MNIKTGMLLLALGVLSGCSSKSDFYQLHTNTTVTMESHSHKRGVPIGIAGVEVADYLSKSEVVTRMSAGRLNVHESQVWAGSLAKNIQSVIQENLSILLPSKTFIAYPWEEPIEDKYRIYVTIDRFDGYETGQVTLKGRWSLVNKEDNSVLYAESINYHAQGGPSLDEIVNTQSSLLDKLSRRIAGKIRNKV